MAIPAVLIGMSGSLLDWTNVSSGQPPHPSLVLPYVLRYWTPPVVAILGLGAVTAAVMSSVDSSVLSASSMFAWNIYRPLIRNVASEREIRLVTRLAIVLLGGAAAILALQVQSVYTLWSLCADLVYVVLFPQLVMALFAKRANTVGALSGAVVALVLRIGGGESLLGLAAWIPYPLRDPELGILFPFRTFAMLASLATIEMVSRLTSRWQPARPLANHSLP